MKRYGRLNLILAGLSLVFFVAGCGGSTTENSPSDTATAGAANDHDHAGEHEHDHAGAETAKPETYSAAIDKLSQLTEEVCTAFKNETPEDAHESLHSVGHLLESLPALASKQMTLPEASMAELNASVETMFDAFTELDGTLHGGEAVDIAIIEEKLTQSLQKLKSFQ